MKLTIEPTGIIEEVDGTPCRLWEGQSDQGVVVKAWVCTVSPQTLDPQALAAFEEELLRHERAPRVEVIRTVSTEPPSDWEEQHARVLQMTRPYFGNLHPAVTGSVLAYLTALWAAAHQVSDGERRVLLDHQGEAIEAMLPVALQEIEAIKRNALLQ